MLVGSGQVGSGWVIFGPIQLAHEWAHFHSSLFNLICLIPSSYESNDSQILKMLKIKQIKNA